jgi:hypothetical protein
MKEKGIDSSPKLRRLSRVDSWIISKRRRDCHCRVFRLPGFDSVLLLSSFVCIIEHRSDYTPMSMPAVHCVTRSPLLPLPMSLQTPEALFDVDSGCTNTLMHWYDMWETKAKLDHAKNEYEERLHQRCDRYEYHPYSTHCVLIKEARYYSEKNTNCAF